MNRIRTRGALTAAAAVIVLAAGSGIAAQAAPEPGDSDRHAADTALADSFKAVDRSTNWEMTGKLKLGFPTFHPQGIAYTEDHIFLSSVEIVEPTVKYPAPRDGYDRTAGKGVGHLFVMDKAGNLQKDIILGEGDMYHPGGLDFDGKNIWVSVAQYRPNSSSIIYSVDAATLEPQKQFEVPDHFGGIVMDRRTGHLIGNTWGSRRFAEWNLNGKQLSTWQNPNHFIDYQDCQYVANSQALCAGVANLPQAPAAGGTAATYELGGMALIDLARKTTLHDVPFQKWSTAGHVATRNPFKLTAEGNHLTMHVAPDDAEEGNGTEILTYEATVTPAK
ncbi:hypothetical protein Arth_0949 [Arthrobacter sp. FB24]|uniref:DUF6454 family protein n=1 Tax=Arthrobacter sp. (strain FB24) TaxID=290399 RepID=UPI000052721D|nr:DUF6454 family protein [Arthrobacter sp. FB24]ABK02346.1 hypothetical protein Arth_0949 [Arthrobacter sp. FB24]